MFVKFLNKNVESLIELGRIFCITSNYRDHIKEMGKTKETPSIFIKPESSLIQIEEGKIAKIPKPKYGKILHHEVEIVMLYLENEINYGVGLDLTLRDVQKKLKEEGKPWFLSKCFDFAAPVSNFYKINNEEKIKIELYVNGNLKQRGTYDEMILKPEEILSFISKFLKIKKGDLIFTGTPAGIGELKKDDLVECFLYENNKKITSFKVKII